jgi:hypothetical protein
MIFMHIKAATRSSAGSPWPNDEKMDAALALKTCFSTRLTLVLKSSAWFKSLSMFHHSLCIIAWSMQATIPVYNFFTV